MCVYTAASAVERGFCCHFYFATLEEAGRPLRAILELASTSIYSRMNIESKNQYWQRFPFICWFSHTRRNWKMHLHLTRDTSRSRGKIPSIAIAIQASFPHTHTHKLVTLFISAMCVPRERKSRDVFLSSWIGKFNECKQMRGKICICKAYGKYANMNMKIHFSSASNEIAIFNAQILIIIRFSSMQSSFRQINKVFSPITYLTAFWGNWSEVNEIN